MSCSFLVWKTQECFNVMGSYVRRNIFQTRVTRIQVDQQIYEIYFCSYAIILNVTYKIVMHMVRFELEVNRLNIRDPVHFIAI